MRRRGGRLYLDSFLLDAPFAAIAAFLALCLLDRQLTIVGARLYQGGGVEHVEFEGGYEANPNYVDEVGRLAVVPSRRYLGGIAFLALWLALVWALVQGDPVWRVAFLLAYGALALPEALLLVRHADSIAGLRRMAAHEGVEGHVRYTRWLAHESAATWAFGSAALALMVADAAWSAMFLGGAIGMLRLGVWQSRLSRRARAGSSSTAATVPWAAVPATAGPSRSRVALGLVAVVILGACAFGAMVLSGFLRLTADTSPDGTATEFPVGTCVVYNALAGGGKEIQPVPCTARHTHVVAVWLGGATSTSCAGWPGFETAHGVLCLRPDTGPAVAPQGSGVAGG